jgi:hypothetical protein
LKSEEFKDPKLMYLHIVRSEAKHHMLPLQIAFHLSMIVTFS